MSGSTRVSSIGLATGAVFAFMAAFSYFFTTIVLTGVFTFLFFSVYFSIDSNDSSESEPIIPYWSKASSCYEISSSVVSVGLSSSFVTSASAYFPFSSSFSYSLSISAN